jgi:6-phosphogluconolactonase
VNPEIHVADRDELREWMARAFERAAAAAIAARGRFAVALPGGSSATEFFPRLAQCTIDWRRTDFFWSDERAVPADDPKSNSALAGRLWLRPAGVPPANWHRLPAELADLEAAARQSESELVGKLGDPPRLDLLWLGVGADGHVASLFPGHAQTAERQRFVAAVMGSPKPPARRLTLTLPAIAAARQVYVTALGKSKAAAIAEALHPAGSQSPLALALAAAPGAILLLDPAAARDLPREAPAVV